MADPVTLGTIAIGSLLGFGASKALGGGGGSSQAAPAAPAALPPDPSTPASTPASKPAQKNSQQQSFLSGAAQLQQAGGATGSSGSKSLLGQ